MSVGVFYLVVHTLLVVEKSNWPVRQQGRPLGDLLTEDQLLYLEDLVNRRKITTDWIQYVFVPRLVDELDHIDWVESGWQTIGLDDPKYARHRDVYERERDTVLARMKERRASAFQRALAPNILQRAESELQGAHRALLTGEVKERLAEYLKQKGPVGVTTDVGKSIVTFIPRGIATTAKTFSNGGFGEHPVKSLAEITVAVPFIIALIRLTLGILRQIVLPFIFSMLKVLWAFILDRVRDLGKAIRDEK
ncbi:hypothetical protein C6496_11475 [Candidatus Poribacteria bacterium]|nr:MAG: hypothetical protein C6496_11475 [Candidatus Poribacteria bacterium]